MTPQAYDINSGFEAILPDWQHCQSFCLSHYPNAKYFTFINASFEDKPFHNTCWCKVSNNNREKKLNFTSGEIACLDTTTNSNTHGKYIKTTDYKSPNKIINFTGKSSSITSSAIYTFVCITIVLITLLVLVVIKFRHAIKEKLAQLILSICRDDIYV